jgi:uncharacterized protein YacL
MNKLSREGVIKVLIAVLVLETVLISLAIALTITMHSAITLAFFPIVYNLYTIPVHFVINIILIIISFIFMIKNRDKANKLFVSFALISFINLYAIYLCLFISSPDVYDLDTLVYASHRFFKLLSLGFL